jgi:hypothetical protein
MSGMLSLVMRDGQHSLRNLTVNSGTRHGSAVNQNRLTEEKRKKKKRDPGLR